MQNNLEVENGHESDGRETEEYIPNGKSEPLTGKAPLPSVKRFNRKTVGVLLAVIGLVVVLAFGTALSRKPMANNSKEPPTQKSSASSALNDSINALPNDYSQVKVPKLGPPLPGDVGAVAVASGVPLDGAPNSPTQNNVSSIPQTKAISPQEQFEQQMLLEEEKRLLKAKDSGFGFSNSGGQSNIGTTNEKLSEVSKLLADASRNNQGNGLPGSIQQTNPARDDDNRQDDKVAFIDKQQRNQFALQGAVQKPKSPYTVFGGTIIPGVLLTGINSDLPGQIKGLITQNVYDTVSGKYLLLPQGTTLIGVYDSRVTYGQQRVLVAWTRLIRPDGSNIDLEGMPGADLSGYAGLTGDVDRHIWRLFGAVLLGSVMQAGAQAGTTINSQGDSTFADRTRQGIGGGINSAAQQIVKKELQIQPTITIEPGQRFNIFTTKDIVIPVYKL